jgi:hypothetical protein
MRQLLRGAAIAAKLLVVRVIIPLCLASACLSRSAEAVETGTSKAKGMCDDNGDCSSTTPIGGVSPPHSGGNPSDFAMCGILYLAGGRFDLLKVARIEVVGDRYELKLNWSGGNPTAPVQVTFTCAHFTEFSGVPAPSEARISFPAPVTAPGGGPPVSKAIAGLTDACIWTGLEGSLSSQGAVHTQIESSGDTFAGAQTTASSLSTYAFCYTYVGKSPSVKYEFVPGSSITWAPWGGSGGDTSTITGEFTYNSTTGALSAVDVKLGGTQGEQGTYNLPLGSPIPPPTKKIGVTNSTGNYVSLRFSGDLAGVSDTLDPAAGVSEYCLLCGSGGAAISAKATGGVVVSSTPPPGWKYHYVGNPELYQHTTINLPGIFTNKYWCFMTGVSGGEKALAFNAGLEIGPSVYAYNTTNGAGLYWNCLPFRQN